MLCTQTAGGVSNRFPCAYRCSSVSVAIALVTSAEQLLVSGLQSTLLTVVFCKHTKARVNAKAARARTPVFIKVISSQENRVICLPYPDNASQRHHRIGWKATVHEKLWWLILILILAIGLGNMWHLGAWVPNLVFVHSCKYIFKMHIPCLTLLAESYHLYTKYFL